TGHGRSSAHRGLTARHARLAVNSASAFVEFVSSTYLARKTPMPTDKP
ncbi:MAG: abortive infection family protein, partial [Paracoccaceae bacterium]|nr:abortive infection family protein [Paracoccaceae bacterium]